MINVVELYQHYGVRPVLCNVSFQVNEGELVTIVGPNGMGKSTLLAAIAGLLCPIDGYVEINGIRRRSSEENELKIRSQIVYLPDHPWLPSERTGREFLLSVGRLYEVPEKRLLVHVQRLLALFNLEEQGDWPIRSYSNGQEKKIAICSALVTDAPILLMDEPFSGGLDPSGILVLKRLLHVLAKRHDVTVMMTTPVPEMVEELSDRVLVLREGKVTAFDTPDGLRRQTNCEGPLTEALQKLIFPEANDQLEQYFSELKE